MKKTLLIVLMLTSLGLLLASCSKTDDPYSAFKNKTAGDIYQKGEVALAKGDYDTAVTNLEALDALYPFGPYAQSGQMDVIYAYYQNDDGPSALAAATRYAHLYPRDPHVDYAIYMQGLVNFDSGQSWLQKSVGSNPESRDLTHFQDAYVSFSNLARQYPNSIYTANAIVRMRYVRNLIAKHNLNVGEFYYSRKAYVASANRGAYVVDHFQGSPLVIPALTMMVRSYRKLGQTVLADKTLVVFQKAYPNAPMLKKLMRG